MIKRERRSRTVTGRRPGSDAGGRSDATAAATAFAGREAAVLASEQAVLGREEAARLREEAAGIREQAVGALELAAKAKAESHAHGETQLREANEQLVVASVNAQIMTEAAEQATVRMSHLAEHDFLTGLPNRSVLSDRLALLIALAQRHGRNVAVVFLDIDHFKHINDSLGHAVGDQLLQSVAKRLQACVRRSDTVGRLGGDEFVMLLAEVEASHGAARAAEKLIEAMAAPHFIGGHRLHVTLSIGISLYPADGLDVDAMIRNADTAMYHAKRNGRNNFHRFTPDMNVGAVARQSVE